MPKARPITEAEFKRAFALAGTSRYPERNQAILALSARAGMRIGEIRDLNLIDVWDDAVEELRDRIYLSADRTKWGHAREIYLSRTTKKVLESHVANRGLAVGALFLSQSGRRFGRTALVTHVKSLYSRAGIDTSSHAGRALFITSLADAGVSIRVIQKAVGHKSLQATNAYLSARPSEVSAAVELLR
ncbi:MAG: tyrosine-type recombinase/integrase [Micropepsaceae bacterium]